MPRYTHTCTCGKRAYSDKKRAKHAARFFHPDDPMDVYECRVSTAGLPAWHYGHHDAAVRDQHHRLYGVDTSTPEVAHG
jgi:hypothetical protein